MLFRSEGNGNPLQCSCLENPRDGGAWWAAVYGVAQTLKRLSSSSSSRGNKPSLTEITTSGDADGENGLVDTARKGADAAVKSLQSCPTLCYPIDGSPPGSPVPGILQGRTLEWVAISLSKRNYRKKESEVTQSCLTLCDPITKN